MENKKALETILSDVSEWVFVDQKWNHIPRDGVLKRLTEIGKEITIVGIGGS
jgi:hypothetical protein